MARKSSAKRWTLVIGVLSLLAMVGIGTWQIALMYGQRRRGAPATAKPLNEHYAVAQVDSDSTHADTNSTAGHSSHPTPREIYAACRKVPLALEAKARAGYVGLAVRWTLELSSVDDIGKDSLMLMLYEPGMGGPPTSCSVNKHDYPVLLTANADDLVHVSGRISEVGEIGIRLAVSHIDVVAWGTE